MLLAQWQGFRSKRRDEKRSLLTQNRKCLEEACALKLESVKVEMEASGSSSDGVSRSVRDADVYVELLARLQKRQDSQCQKMLDVGSRVRKFGIRSFAGWNVQNGPQKFETFVCTKKTKAS